jgi:hypothetical protein
MGMIRDTIEPVPAYTSRLIEHEGKQVLAARMERFWHCLLLRL